VVCGLLSLRSMALHIHIHVHHHGGDGAGNNQTGDIAEIKQTLLTMSGQTQAIKTALQSVGVNVSAINDSVQKVSADSTYLRNKIDELAADNADLAEIQTLAAQLDTNTSQAAAALKTLDEAVNSEDTGADNGGGEGEAPQS